MIFYYISFLPFCNPDSGISVEDTAFTFVSFVWFLLQNMVSSLIHLMILLK